MPAFSALGEKRSPLARRIVARNLAKGRMKRIGAAEPGGSHD